MGRIGRFTVITLMVVGFSLAAAGCKSGEKAEPAGQPTTQPSKSEHPKGEHPKSEHPKGEHPK